MYGITSEFIFSTNRTKTKYTPRAVIPIPLVNMLNCLAYCLGQSKMNERVPDMTPNKILLDVRVSTTTKQKKRCNKNI